MSGRGGKTQRAESVAVPALVALDVLVAARGGATNPGVASLGSSTTTTAPGSGSKESASVKADYTEALRFPAPQVLSVHPLTRNSELPRSDDLEPSDRRSDRAFGDQFGLVQAGAKGACFPTPRRIVIHG
ncbi:MAG: hypothetical protein WB770_06310 [Acidimicrobiales bacterium]